ncbi:TonB-dependent receptor [Pleionea sediminis]|uniref:TonB-dependent receptor n=1 Tax=Pleionea sediminis TaxID=2569479 RepID=UPI0011847BF8|nr:TonB-dependent receptor [Pleionea sediminis]
MTKLNLISRAVSATVLLMASNSYADSTGEVGNISLEDLLNIEVTSASKIATKISEAPAVVTAYKQKQLDQYGFNVINDLLYTLPGFGPSQDYDRPTVGTRGNFDSWSNNHILHLVDGIPLNDNLYGTAYTWLTPVFFTKTLEVIRGPGSALYGSNATNGVVQMNTFKGADLNGKFYTKFSPLPGSYGTRRMEAMTGTQSGNLDFIMAYSYHQTDGNNYMSYDGSGRLSGDVLSDGSPEAARFMTRDNRDDSYFWSKLSIGDEWQFQYHRQEWDFDTYFGWLFWIPDYDEEMNESRDIFSIKYSGNISDNLSHEYVVRYQRHDITWNQRYYPDDAFGGYYPSGMWEYLDTDANDIFVRAQVTYLFGDSSGATFLAGFEGDRFSYVGDDEHFSNINVDSEFFEPFPGDINTSLGPWLDYVKDEPILNTAFYAQLTTGNWLSSDFEMTFGVRSDNLDVDYKEVYTPGQPGRSKSFSRVSPRLAGVWSASDNLVLKMMWGKAFRAPTPTEMAGAHTFSLASNIAELDPELITTTEFQSDWKFDSNHVFRANLFLTEFENQIAYSTVNQNLSTNIYSTENLGYEFEFIGNYGSWNWFANISYVTRQDESILAFDDQGTPNDPADDIPEFSQHDSDIKWEPGLKINFGAAFEWEKLSASFNAHFHGEVERRDSDNNLLLGDCDFDGNIDPEPNSLPLAVCVPTDFNLVAHRGDKVDSWLTINSRVSYELKDNAQLTLEIKNLLDEEGYLAKTGPFPFDYRIPERQLMFFVEFGL